MIEKFNLLIVLFLVISPATRAGADVYSWTDQNGVRHFSNIGPPDTGHANHLTEIMESLPTGTRFRVKHIFDGDTLEAEGAGISFKVRLVGIDCPETGHNRDKGQPFGLQAKQFLEQQVAGQDIWIKQYGTGGYNRVLGEIFTGGQNVNLQLLENGLAEIYQGRLPKNLDKGAYQAAMARARARNIGIWSLGPRYKSPRQWRKEHPWK